MRNFIRLMNLVIVLECLVACGSSKTSSDTPAAVAASAIDITGTWLGSCKVTSSGDIYRSSYTIGAKSYIKSFVSYLDTDCITPLIIYTVVSDYAIGDALAIGGYKLDVTIQSESVQLMDASNAKLANKGQYWGYTNWAKGQLNVITGKKDPNGVVVNQGDKIYDIVKLVDTSVFGGDSSTGNAKSDATRPTAYATVPYLKQ